MANAQPTPGLQADTSGGVPGQAHIRQEPARIAVYSQRDSPPHIVTIPATLPGEDDVPDLIDELTEQTHTLAREQGGRLPTDLVRELVANLVHASFAEVVITILDGGNTLRVSDRGPGIPDKHAAVRAGFTSADAWRRSTYAGWGPVWRCVTAIASGMDGTSRSRTIWAGERW